LRCHDTSPCLGLELRIIHEIQIFSRRSVPTLGFNFLRLLSLRQPSLSATYDVKTFAKLAIVIVGLEVLAPQLGMLRLRLRRQK
jgi:hypothetical protein